MKGRIKYLLHTNAALSQKLIGVSLVIAYMAYALVALPHYLPWTSVNFILGLIGLPLTFLYGVPDKTSMRFYPVALVFIALYFYFPENTVLFFAIVSATLCLGELLWQKLSLLSLISLAFMSTTVQYLAGIFSFPIRLSITHLAGTLLHTVQSATTSTGNMITYGGHEYSVDPACMGLKMLLTSLLFGLFIIAVLQHQQRKYLSWYWVLFVLLAVFMLNLVSNLVRILILVMFNIGPEKVMHEITGLLCLLVYVLFPATLIIRALVARFGTAASVQSPTISDLRFPRWKIGGHIVLAGVIALAIWKNEPNAVIYEDKIPLVSGYASSWYDKEVQQFSNDRSLVYIKKIRNALGSEHNPVMCWIGAGYQFQKVSRDTIHGVEVYTGVLKKGSASLYTAWWYDNGSVRTIGQLDWRIRALKGARPFSVINVTAASESQLKQQLDSVLRNNIFEAAL